MGLLLLKVLAGVGHPQVTLLRSSVVIRIGAGSLMLMNGRGEVIEVGKYIG